jgi:hypothetical protein
VTTLGRLGWTLIGGMAIEQLLEREDTLEKVDGLGAAQRRSGHDAEALATLSSALDLADRCGAVAVANEARGEPVAAGSRPRRNRLRGRAGRRVGRVLRVGD